MRLEGLGGRIKRARLATGRSQAALAAELGVQPHTVYRYERDGDGAIDPPLDTIATIASLCGVSTDWLLTGEGEGPPEPAAEPDADLAPTGTDAA